jgi:hypothetical protein
MTIGHAMPLRKMFIDKQLQASIETARSDLARCRFSGLRRKVQHNSRHINNFSSVTHQDVPFAYAFVLVERHLILAPVVELRRARERGKAT